jgi:hypothetical protein
MKYLGKTPLNNEHTLEGQECKTSPVRRRVLVGGRGN